VFDVEPPPNVDASFYRRFAVGSLRMEKDKIEGLKSACQQLGVLASRNGVKEIRNKVGLVLIVNDRIVDVGRL